MESEFPALIAAVRTCCGPEPFDLAVVLGSGLGGAVEAAEPLGTFPYDDFPEFPPSRVSGHAGRLVAARLAGRRLLYFVGRCHLYEGYDARTVAAPVRLAHALGCRKLLLSNASGGIHPDFGPGDFMYIADHINLLGDNPLRGESHSPFVDLSRVYCQDFFPALAAFAETHGIRLFSGVLAACLGPSYETPAEIRALSRLGADAVSMSTVPEAIMARYLGMETAGLSLIANRAAGLAPTPLSHQEVLEVGARAARDFRRLLDRVVGLWLATPLNPRQTPGIPA